jgi:hypothetical protein
VQTVGEWVDAATVQQAQQVQQQTSQLVQELCAWRGDERSNTAALTAAWVSVAAARCDAEGLVASLRRPFDDGSPSSDADADAAFVQEMLRTGVPLVSGVQSVATLLSTSCREARTKVRHAHATATPRMRGSRANRAVYVLVSVGGCVRWRT